MALEPRSANKPFLSRESRVISSEGSLKTNLQLNHSYVRTVLVTLNRDQGLWQSSLNDALMKVLKVCVASMGCQVASVWRRDSASGALNCLAQYESGLGSVKTDEDSMILDGESFLTGFLSAPFLCVNSCFTDERVAEAFESYFAKYDVQSLLSATIYQKGEPVGLVIFEHLGGTKHWTEVEQFLAQSVADLLGKLMLTLELRRQQRLLKVLESITQISASELMPDQLVEYLIDQLHELSPDAWVGFYQTDNDDLGKLQCSVGDGIPDYACQAISEIHLEGELYQALVEDADLYIVGDTAQWDAPINLSAVDIAVALDFESIMFVPLKLGHEMLGFVQIWSRDRQLELEARHQLYRSLGSSFAVSYSNAVSVQGLRFDVSHDGLTGLSNEDQLFVDFINLDVRKPHLLMLLQLAEFNQVHDVLGRDSADEVLKIVATRLLSFAKDKDDTQVYRFTGTEFCLLVSNPMAVRPIAEEVLECVLPPIDIDGLSIVVQPALGLTLTPDHGRDCDLLLKNLDQAVNQAKQSDQSIYLYEPVEDQLGTDEQRLIQDLKAALADDQLMLYYQPEFDLEGGGIKACEALLRWQHPEQGFIAPSRLVRLAESAGLMRTLTQWVIKQAVSQISIFNVMELSIEVSVNLSAQDLVDQSLPAFIQTVLTEFGVDAEQLRIEVTESALMSDFKLAKKSLKDLAKIGLQLDIDNFGLGYSSIANLYELSLASVKIDRYFVNDIASNASHEAVVRSIIGMAHGLGVRVVGEGVEDDATADKLKLLGCDIAQGYCFGKPLPAAEFITSASH